MRFLCASTLIIRRRKLGAGKPVRGHHGLSRYPVAAVLSGSAGSASQSISAFSQVTEMLSFVFTQSRTQKRCALLLGIALADHEASTPLFLAVQVAM
jgi:hypothetical protein